MKTAMALVAGLLLLLGCGGERPERTAVPDSTPPARDTAPTPAVAQAAGNPCAPLEAKMVRYDTRGKPFLFSFEVPDGFVVNEFYGPGTAGADLNFDLDGDGHYEYVLRLAQNDRTLENVEAMVESLRKHPMTEDVSEVAVDGRTLYIQRTRIGEMVGFSAFFPNYAVADGAHLIMGGITAAPKPCQDQAVTMVARILGGLERNPEVGQAPVEN